MCTNVPEICTNFPKIFLKNIVTRFFNNFRIYGTPSLPGVYNDTKMFRLIVLLHSWEMRSDLRRMASSLLVTKKCLPVPSFHPGCLEVTCSCQLINASEAALQGDLFTRHTCGFSFANPPPPQKRHSGIGGLAAQCEIPPPYRAIPFRDSIAEGGIARLCLVFIGYRASIAEIPFPGGGVSHLHFTCSPRGKHSEKGEGVSHPIGHVETPQTP